MSRFTQGGLTRGVAPQVLILATSLAMSPLFLGSVAKATPAASSRADIGKYLGVWAYDEPRPTTGANVAVVVLGPTDRLKVPQIGTVRFSADPAAGTNAVVGVTDQGCTWHFKATQTSLELASPGQSCFNKVIDSAYTMRKWSVTVHGQRERESIVASSDLTYGTFPFDLADGRRTKVNARNTPGDAARFSGHWTYGPSSAFTNILTVASGSNVSSQPIADWPVYTTDGGRRQPRPGKAQVTFARDRDGTVVAVTQDGCRWHFQLFGNTAELDHPQTCRLAHSAEETMNFWSAAVQGSHEDSVLSGTVRDSDGTATTFALSIGSLTRNPH